MKLNLPEKEIIRAYINGMPSTVLGKMYGCSNCTILARLRANNIHVRTWSECRQKEKNGNYGKPRSLECRRKQSETRRRLGIGKGKENPNYKHGKAKERTNKRHAEMLSLHYREWRKAVLKRDNYICQMCHKHSTHLEAHHIQSWRKHEELRYELSNGLTLCVSCHRNVAKGVNK